MAVARARHLQPQVLHHLLQAAKRTGMPKLVREVQRAQLRPGRGVELNGSELDALMSHATGDATVAVLNQMASDFAAATKFEKTRDERTRAIVRRAQERMTAHGAQA